MGPTWVLSAPDGPHVGPMNLPIRDIIWDESLCIYENAITFYPSFTHEHVLFRCVLWREVHQPDVVVPVDNWYNTVTVGHIRLARVPHNR